MSLHRFDRSILGLFSLGFFVGCAAWGTGLAGSGRVSPWLQDGMVAMTRPVPEVSSANSNSANALPSFLPSSEKVRRNLAAGTTAIDSKAKVISLAGQEKIEILGSNCDDSASGLVSVVLKQELPAWYAPDEYFTNRHATLPAQHSPERFLRGALGSGAIFLDNGIVVHSGPYDIQEAKQIRVSEASLARLYERLALGAKVDFK